MSSRLEFKSVMNSESGQAMIEFVLTVFLLFALIFFFIQLSLILSFGNYTQYAVFMSSRAYLSAGQTREDQEERAQSVIVQTVKGGLGRAGQDRFPSIAEGVGGAIPKGAEIGSSQNFNRDDINLSWMQGVRYTFRSRIFLLPVGRGTSTPNAGFLTLTSESWLGRDPTTSECESVMGSKLYDNGC